MKVLVYADSVREARKFYPERAGQAVGWRVAGDFKEVEKADLVLYAKPYDDIEVAYAEATVKPKGKRKK